MFNDGSLSAHSLSFSCSALYHRDLSFPVSVVLWLLGDSAKGRYWQEVEGWERRKRLRPFSCSLFLGHLQQHLCPLSMLPSPSI